MSARYAIYYAPPADTPLWRKGSAWLGRDAVTGAGLPRPILPGLHDVDTAALTADPRHYGFHATLKAPMALAAGCAESQLLRSAEAFAAAMSPFEATVAPAELDRFLALRLQDGAARMSALHEACMRAFDPFRAPPTDLDRARRRRAPLTPRQEAQLERWGYPYVFEDFRFHMTLTSRIEDASVRARVLRALQAYFADLSGPHRFDGITVFRQPDRETPFDILERFAFTARIDA